MQLRVLSAAATICAVTACGPKTGTVAPPPGPAVPGPVAPPAVTAPITRGGGDVVRLGPSALRYVVHHRSHVEEQYPGQTRTADQGLRVFLAATIVGPADSIGYPLTFTVDSVVLDSGTTIPPTVNLAAGRGLRYTGHLTPAGEFMQTSTSDSSIAQVLVQVIGSFRNFYPRMPLAGLKPGADWTDTTSTNDRVAIDVNIKVVAHSRTGTWEERNGSRCLRIESNSTYSVSGSGTQMNQPLEVTGTGSRTGVQFVAVDGRYLGGEAHDSSSITVGLPMQGMTVPVRQITHSTVTVLP
ncbi:MAG TPA: hypothetical protein VK467_10375 [Gemmatimonadales bacterium]|nr:hypothetical protein [Gemmatimonadales bacterium]